MLRLLVLAVVLSASVADEEPQATALPDPDPIQVYNDHMQRVEKHRLRESLSRLRSDLHRSNDRYHDDRHRDDRHRDHEHNDERWWEPRDDVHDRDDFGGPVILRSIRPDEHGHHTPDIARQNKIIADVYSPDYAEPTWVLDYRYLKTGGRDYTRGPGGQIIILPKGIRSKEHKEFKDYDELIEHLRLKNLAERKKPQYFMPLGQGASNDDKDSYRDRHDNKDWWGN